jgi:hypothetical protein
VRLTVIAPGFDRNNARKHMEQATRIASHLVIEKLASLQPISPRITTCSPSSVVNLICSLECQRAAARDSCTVEQECWGSYVRLNWPGFFHFYYVTIRVGIPRVRGQDAVFVSTVANNVASLHRRIANSDKLQMGRLREVQLL